jgi:integrase/recombinase XerD
MGQLCDRMVQAMQLRNYSIKTIKTYVSMLRGYVRMFGKSPEEMGEEEVQRYLDSLVERKVSSATVRLTYSALKFLYVETLQREWKLRNLPPAKREKRLPVVLSPEEVKRLFDATTNVKHRTVLMTCYSAGVRVAEAVHLKPTDIDSNRMLIRVEQGKGKKDRYTLLATTLLEQLRMYWRMYRPREWVFNGVRPGTPLSTRTVQQVFTNAKKKRGSLSPSASTLCATALPRTCWRLEQTSSSFSGCLATPV